MSSHTAAAFEAARSDIRSQSAWNNKEIVVHGIALLVSFTFTAHQAHLAARSISGLGAVSAALFCATLLPQRFPLAQASPLELDRTVRLLRGFVFGMAIVLPGAILLSQAAISILRLFLCFVVILATVRTAINVGSVQSAGITTEQIASQGKRGNARVKRCFDKVIAFVALLILGPLFLIIAVAIKLDSPGPVLFSHQRVGYRGKRFWILKFRSMHVHAAKYQRSPADLGDFRITRVGRLLRRTSLDEIPQLINVLRGEMSLVGPRPEMPYIANTYTAVQRKRLEALPGITGLWQISPARALPIHHNMQYDLYYIAHRSVLMDLAILCRTTESVVRGIGAA